MKKVRSFENRGRREKMAVGCKEKIAFLYFVMAAQASYFTYVLASTKLWTYLVTKDKQTIK